MFSPDCRIPRKLILLNRLFSARLSKRERSTSDVTHPAGGGSRSGQQQSSSPHQSHPRGTYFAREYISYFVSAFLSIRFALISLGHRKVAESSEIFILQERTHEKYCTDRASSFMLA
jgi:hypothetical protein